MRPQFVTAVSQIRSDADVVRLSTDAARTLTSTPTINTGVDGQIIRLMNVNTGAFNITLQDRGTLSGSGLYLTNATVILGPYDSINLEYVSGVGWVQVGNLVATA
ncbi:hypothetical protein D9M71_726410 [compost metagenome]